MGTKVVGGWTCTQKQYLNSMTICSLRASGSGLLFLHWIFSSVCCILPRYYISFVVFVYFPVPYTLRSCSEMSHSAGTDLHTNNIVLARGSGKVRRCCQVGQAQLETSKSFQASSQGGWIIALHSRWRIHWWWDWQSRLPGFTTGLTIVGTLQFGQDWGNTESGIHHPSLMSWCTQSRLNAHTFSLIRVPFLAYMCWDLEPEWNSRSSWSCYKFMGSFVFPEPHKLGKPNTITKQTLAKFEIPNTKVHHFHTSHCTCAAVLEHS